MKHLAYLLLVALGTLHAQDTPSPTPTTDVSPASNASLMPTDTATPAATPTINTVATPAPSPSATPKNSGFTFNINTGDEKKVTHSGTFAPIDLEDILVPTVAIIFIFGAPVVLVALILAYRMKKKRLLHQTIEKIVASGQPIPPELIASSGAKPLPTVQSDLRRGIFLTCIGVGTILWQLISGGSCGIGFLPLAIGVGYLLSARFTTRDGDKN